MDDLFDVLFSDDDDDEQEKENLQDLNVDANRKIVVERLFRTLKKLYFFDDEELKPIAELLNNYFAKIDEVNKSVDASKYGLLSSQKMEMDLLTIQKAMLRDLKQKIKATMRAKVEEAKEYFKNKENDTKKQK